MSTPNAPTAVLYMPQGSGKSTHAAAIAALLGCTSVADEWTPGNALVPGALHLTNSLLIQPTKTGLSVDELWALQCCFAIRKFWTVYDLMVFCGIDQLPDLESQVRQQLDREGWVRTKRPVDGVPTWGYSNPTVPENLGWHNLIPSKPLHPLAVSTPPSLTDSWYATVVIEVYALGRGVTVNRQEGDLAGREGTLELKAPRVRLVFDQLAAERTKGLVLLVQRNVTAVLQPLQAENEEREPELALIECGHGDVSSQKTAILSLPPGMGKTTVAHRLAKWLGCIGVVDEWAPGRPMFAGALHLTNVDVPQGGAQ